MIDSPLLEILLHGRRIGSIARLDGDRSIFSLDRDYAQDADRLTLSLAYKGDHGDLYDQPRSYQTKIEPFFSNLLPEGVLREFLARRAGVKIVREYPLLAQLGRDLPGAVQAIPIEGIRVSDEFEEEDAARRTADHALRFSLAGVQLKFTAIAAGGKHGGLAIPISGVGGDWIVKLPSARHLDVPENEFAAMQLAHRLGMDVPDIALLPIEKVSGLPNGIEQLGPTAFAIRRFDRSAEGPVHMEDFAQVFGIFADDKYENASYGAILRVLAIETDETSVVEFVRRLTYSVLIGNGDMHLKNWSLIYLDGRHPTLSPAYDLLSTLPYIPADVPALNFHRSREWTDYSYALIETLADRARLPSHLLVQTARETVERFDQLWSDEHQDLPFTPNVKLAIEAHRARLAI